MAKAAKRKIAKPQETSPQSLMERLAALQREFAAQVEEEAKKQSTS